jgi:dolichol-phosphate mannosyltransferase
LGEGFKIIFMKDIILFPTYNERENIKIIVPEIFNLYPEINILVIDDNSPDETAREVESLMVKYPNLLLLERKNKTGLGDAYKEAIQKVIKDKDLRSVITMDADGSHDPKYIKDFLRNIEAYDLVVGSRYTKGGGVENWEFWRKMLSKFGNLYVNILIGFKIKDLTAGFVCARRDLLEKINFSKIDSSGYAYQIEFKYYCVNVLKAKYKEVPIIFKKRREGESKISKQIIREGVIAPLKIFLKKLWRI